jgi:hypothetical protein
LLPSVISIAEGRNIKPKFAASQVWFTFSALSLVLHSLCSQFQKHYMNKKDTFVPRQSKRMARRNIVPDGDIWVEKKRRVRNGSKMSYFHSVKTGRCQWNEPPTGASIVVYIQQLPRCPPGLQAFAREPYHGDVFRSIRGAKRQKRAFRRRPEIGFEE